MSAPAIRDRILELRRVRAGDLVPNPKNWRRHPAAQRKAMAAMLANIGYADAALARETPEGLMLIDGHLRASLDADQVIPVLVLDVDEAEADRLLVTLDPLAAMAVTDEEAFAGLVGSVDLPADEAVDELVRGVSGSIRHRGVTNPDDLPATPTEATETVPGDLWRCGDHVIACVDASDPAMVAAVLEGRRVDLMFTDPPYGVSYEGATAERLTLINDDLPAAELEALLERVFSIARDQMASGAAFYICTPGVADLMLAFLTALVRAGLRVRQQIVWIKDKLVLGHGDFQWRHEGLLYGAEDDPSVFAVDPGSDWAWAHEAMVYGWAPGTRVFNGDRKQTTVWQVARSHGAGFIHPTVKPVELVARAVALSSRPKGLVFDPFLGSGSTTIACQQLNRASVGLDIDPLYVERAVRRWEEFTGRSAERVPGGARG